MPGTPRLTDLERARIGVEVLVPIIHKEMMQGIDALDLGALLLCDGDFPAAEAWGLDLQRTQTCMQGASQCDFRYRLRRS